MDEKKKIQLHRWIWAIACLFCLLFPALIDVFQPELEMVESNCYITEYYEYLDETSCELEVTFNREVDSGYVTVAFYDDNGNYLETVECYCIPDYIDGTVAIDSYFNVKGKMSYFEVISYDIEPATGAYWALSGFLVITITLFISALLLSYKEITWKGKKISVYAGFYHHTLRINGELCDTHNTIFTYSAIKLSTTVKGETEEEKESIVEATITLTNRISIKVDNKLVDGSQK